MVEQVPEMEGGGGQLYSIQKYWGRGETVAAKAGPWETTTNSLVGVQDIANYLNMSL